MQNQTVFLSRKSLSVSARILLVLILMMGALPVLSVGAQATNLALNKPVTCSSIEHAGFPCASAVDGNAGTRWSSAHGVDPQWIYVDLGQTYTISQVILRWEPAYATPLPIAESLERWCRFDRGRRKSIVGWHYKRWPSVCQGCHPQRSRRGSQRFQPRSMSLACSVHDLCC